MSELFSWTVVGILAPLVFGVGISVLGMTPVEVGLAKFCFLIASALLLGKLGVWALYADLPLTERALIVFVVSGLTCALLVESIRWADAKKAAERSAAIEPVVEISIGKPFENKSLIMVKNTGVDSILDVSVNLRCFLLTQPEDPKPGLFFEGYPSIDNATSWWVINKLEPDKKVSKDALGSVERCLQNSTMFPGITYTQLIFAVDVSYRRQSDHKMFNQSRIAALSKDSGSGKPFLWPLSITKYHRHILDTVFPPSFS